MGNTINHDHAARTLLIATISKHRSHAFFFFFSLFAPEFGQQQLPAVPARAEMFL